MKVKISPKFRKRGRIPWKVCLFGPSLSFCHEKATVALYFGRIRTRLARVSTEKFPGGRGATEKRSKNSTIKTLPRGPTEKRL